MANLETDYQKILETQKNNLTSQRNESEKNINSVHDSQIKSLKDEYNNSIHTVKTGYESDYQRNAVQKYINEKAIAEKNANLGLTNSGLNRTQQTAVQLSYANQKSNIDSGKNNALNELTQSLNSAISNIEQNRTSALNENNMYWDNIVNNNAQNMYAQNLAYNQNLMQLEQNERFHNDEMEYNKLLLEQNNKLSNKTEETENIPEIPETAEISEYIRTQCKLFDNERELADYLDKLVDKNIITENDADMLFEEMFPNRNLPLDMRDWTMVDDGGINWFGGIDNNGKVRDQYGNEYTMKEIYNNLKTSIGSKKAKEYVINKQKELGITK